MTPSQKRALEHLSANDGASAYTLKVTLNTLNALSLKKFVRAEHSLGSMAWPRTGISWFITDEGRKALRANGA